MGHPVFHLFFEVIAIWNQYVYVSSIWEACT